MATATTNGHVGKRGGRGGTGQGSARKERGLRPGCPVTRPRAVMLARGAGHRDKRAGDARAPRGLPHRRQGGNSRRESSAPRRREGGGTERPERPAGPLCLSAFPLDFPSHDPCQPWAILDSSIAGTQRSGKPRSSSPHSRLCRRRGGCQAGSSQKRKERKRKEKKRKEKKRKEKKRKEIRENYKTIPKFSTAPRGTAENGPSSSRGQWRAGAAPRRRADPTGRVAVLPDGLRPAPVGRVLAPPELSRSVQRGLRAPRQPSRCPPAAFPLPPGSLPAAPRQPSRCPPAPPAALQNWSGRRGEVPALRDLQT
ncbi:serine/arginine repetitive matrix protein 1-like isoform X1 [Prinia subflava]|uniref:serine/arginine repetitive matrix protein 1-like isoform X1 n=1 Tax=Prinia subflava TaxID=208062 RepID=UPI002FE3135B